MKDDKNFKNIQSKEVKVGFEKNKTVPKIKKIKTQKA